MPSDWERKQMKRQHHNHQGFAATGIEKRIALINLSNSRGFIAREAVLGTPRSAVIEE